MMMSLFINTKGKKWEKKGRLFVERRVKTDDFFFTEMVPKLDAFEKASSCQWFQQNTFFGDNCLGSPFKKEENSFENFG